ncbi:MAG: winged helix-turn-helix transcriptional regulator [Nanoarchaeota archaeon]
MPEITKIKLDKTDRKILSELDKDCRIPATILARKVGKSRQAVEYRINKLVEKGIITSFNAAINPHKMGYKIYKVYLKLRNIPSEKQRLFTWLKESGIVYWMGECSGSWDLIFGVFTRGDYEFFELKNQLISEFNELIIDEYGDALLDVKQYPKMYFTGTISAPTMFAGEVVENKLDPLDYEILGEIVNNARIPLTVLAEKVRSSHTVVHARLKRLETLGVIIQYRIGVNLRILGLDLYKAIIKLDKYSKEDEHRLLEHFSRLTNIHYYIRNLWQIEPELVVDSYQEYYQIIEEAKKAFPQVIRTVDSVLMISDEWTPGFRNLLKTRNETPDR